MGVIVTVITRPDFTFSTPLALFLFFSICEHRCYCFFKKTCWVTAHVSVANCLENRSFPVISTYTAQTQKVISKWTWSNHSRVEHRIHSVTQASSSRFCTNQRVLCSNGVSVVYCLLACLSSDPPPPSSDLSAQRAALCNMSEYCSSWKKCI